MTLDQEFSRVKRSKWPCVPHPGRLDFQQTINGLTLRRGVVIGGKKNARRARPTKAPAPSEIDSDSDGEQFGGQINIHPHDEEGGHIRCSESSSADADDHAYIMAKALRSYHEYEAKENRPTSVRGTSTKSLPRAARKPKTLTLIPQIHLPPTPRHRSPRQKKKNQKGSQKTSPKPPDLKKMTENMHSSNPLNMSSRDGHLGTDSVSRQPVGGGCQVEGRIFEAPRKVVTMARRNRSSLNFCNGPVVVNDEDAAKDPRPGDWVRRVACCPRQRPSTAHSKSNGTTKQPSVPRSATSRSMDRIGSARDDTYRRNVKFDTTFFSMTRSPRKQYFTIHPEWVSENLSVQKMTLQEKCATFPPRRCKSAPPPRSRNPITWENWTVTPKR